MIFFNGNKLEQEPTYIIHGHLIHTFRPGLWVSTSVGYDYGGKSRINGIDKNDRKQDVAWALGFAYPINRHSGFKATCPVPSGYKPVLQIDPAGPPATA